jgi:lipid-A-disaccharide synthase
MSTASPVGEEPKQVMIIAGEASGDTHAAEMFQALRAMRPGLQAYGMGSTRMRDAGIDLLVDANEISVMGLWEVLIQYRKLKRTLKYLQDEMLRRRPDLLILVDFVEFNLKLAEAAKQAGIRVLFYVSPQIWAWRPGRIHKIGQKIDMMAVIFPFEVSYYRKAGIPVRYVGHPLVDQVMESRAHAVPIDLEGPGPIVGLLPGSRRGEIQRILPTLLESAALLHEEHADIQFLLPLAHTLTAADLQPLLDQYPDLPLTLIKGRSHDVMAASDAVMAASGTATLEIALYDVPMAIVYRLSPLSYWILKSLVNIDYVGLPNIVAGREVVREFIQGEARAELICEEIDRILTDPDYQAKIRAGLKEIRDKLGEGGGTRRVAMVADEMLDGRIISE